MRSPTNETAAAAKVAQGARPGDDFIVLEGEGGLDVA